MCVCVCEWVGRDSHHRVTYGLARKGRAISAEIILTITVIPNIKESFLRTLRYITAGDNLNDKNVRLSNVKNDNLSNGMNDNL